MCLSFPIPALEFLPYLVYNLFNKAIQVDSPLEDRAYLSLLSLRGAGYTTTEAVGFSI